MSTRVTIIGAGLTGLMCAIHLAQRNCFIEIFEKRSHLEICAPKYRVMGQPGRSMSMDISSRGIFALKSVCLFDEIMREAVPMKYKITHEINGHQSSLPYGQFDNEEILTVSRTHLYQALLNKCFQFPNIKINFGCQLQKIAFDTKSIEVRNVFLGTPKSISSDILIGADGINSLVRELSERYMTSAFVASYFPMSYKELSIPHDRAQNLTHNAMHVWPRPGMMLVAQPNIDSSFTCALLMHENAMPTSFANVTAQEIRRVFDVNFSDVSNQMPFLEDEYEHNPVGKLKIIAGSQWAIQDFMLLIGDAAHGMVPFFGQGVNCCFEDCTYLADALDRSSNNWPLVLQQFNSQRVQEANAINTMSYENYPELFPDANLSRARLIKEVEAALSANYRNSYRTYHNLVCFDRVPYTFAQKVKSLQVRLLERICKNIDRVEQLDFSHVDKEMNNYHRALVALKQNQQN